MVARRTVHSQSRGIQDWTPGSLSWRSAETAAARMRFLCDVAGAACPAPSRSIDTASRDPAGRRSRQRREKKRRSKRRIKREEEASFARKIKSRSSRSSRSSRRRRKVQGRDEGASRRTR
ncbi:hypothetical protein MGYG_09088 [Nannizzia gypsea CBS 118893]|uniref:Uncharacterized protein n=1 Tax=Arthroderma gypseum (strain ATCC MYA-4604 / CBS 118893) TaxID=535722 RepID=E4UW51_ARTGP|nr:hypothetical protein MGYG_09088 [Nannizzia gypsea CBS 118893]EFR02499.1 hypothetical protein MGYG_09088 [Nannizzia gypsea CBS 118893]